MEKTQPKERSRWLIFSLLAVAQFMVVLDVSITNVALPMIKSDLHFIGDSLQWVITAYALSFGGFLLLGGRTADLFGRRKTLLIGMSAFSFFSLLIGLSHSPFLLITLRALQGIAAAFMSPSALSIVLVTFKDGGDRNRALSLWTLMSSGGAAVGLLLGGVLTQYLGWRWNFFINVPIGIIVSILIYQIVPRHEKEESSKTLDMPGALLVTGGLIAVVYALSEASQKGWLSLSTLGTIALSTVLLFIFVLNERRAKHPLVPLSIFRIQNIKSANVMMAATYATLLGMFFLTSLYTQTILHYSPALTGLSFLPFPIILGFMSLRMPRLVARFGYKPFLLAGPIIVAIGLALLSRVPADGHYWINVFPTLLIMPFGIGMIFMPIYAAATAGVPAQESGLASGLITTSQQMGGAVGLAVLSGVATSFIASPIEGYDIAFRAGIGFAVVAFICALTIRQLKKTALDDTIVVEG